jgi:glyoxylase-like metal-dependent hydrolase (beta-lactamase superfamily II)
MRSFAALAILLGVQLLAAARTLSPSETACIRGRELVDTAAQAMGGVAFFDASRKLDGFRVEIGQTRRPGIEYTTQPYKVVNALDFQNGRYFEEVWTSVIGGYQVHFRQVANDSNPVAAAAFAGGRASPYRYPEAVLRLASNRYQTLRWIGTTEEAGARYDMVNFSDPFGAQLTLYFDAATHLLTMTEVMKDEPVFSLAGAMSYRWEYRDYRQVQSSLLPAHYVTRYGGELLEDLKLTEIKVNSHPADNLFDVPPATNAATPVPLPVKVADDVYFLAGGINSMFVVFHDYVLVIEGGGTDALAQRNIAKIKEVAPGRAIRYVVATHYHHDHIRGLRNYMVEGSTIVTTGITKSEVEKLAATSPRLRPDALAMHPKEAKFEIFTGKRSFTDGTHTVDLYDIGPTPHVDEMIIAYLPKEKVLYEADALDIVGDEAPQVNADTLDMVEKLHKLGLELQVIAPAHGRLGSIEDLRKGLEKPQATH